MTSGNGERTRTSDEAAFLSLIEFSGRLAKGKLLDAGTAIADKAHLGGVAGLFLGNIVLTRQEILLPIGRRSWKR